MAATSCFLLFGLATLLFGLPSAVSSTDKLVVAGIGGLSIAVAIRTWMLGAHVNLATRTVTVVRYWRTYRVDFSDVLDFRTEFDGGRAPRPTLIRRHGAAIQIPMLQRGILLPELFAKPDDWEPELTQLREFVRAGRNRSDA